MRDLELRADLAGFGIHFGEAAIMIPEPTPADAGRSAWRRDWRIAADSAEVSHLINGDIRVAMDAQPGTITAASAGIPAFLTNIVDPQTVRVLTQPMRVTEIIGEEKKGDWTTLSTQFGVTELAGQVSSYGDYNNNGMTDVNGNWVARQSFQYQTHLRYGEREIAMWGAASINKKAELETAAAFVFAKFANRAGFYGIAGLKNYGLLNDPSLLAPSTPATKAAGGTSWTNATAQEIYNDVLALYTQLNVQMGYNLDMNMPMTLVVSGLRMPALLKISNFNIPAKQSIMAAFPNLTIKEAPEYSTAGGELMQLILPTYEGIRTAYAAFTEKMRAHPLIALGSAWQQKKSAGTWGAIVRRPNAIGQMLGI
jgi:hypothetical protein